MARDWRHRSENFILHSNNNACVPVLSWFISPLLAGFVSSVFYLIVKFSVLMRRHTFEVRIKSLLRSRENNLTFSFAGCPESLSHIHGLHTHSESLRVHLRWIQVWVTVLGTTATPDFLQTSVSISFPGGPLFLSLSASDVASDSSCISCLENGWEEGPFDYMRGIWRRRQRKQEMWEMLKRAANRRLKRVSEMRLDMISKSWASLQIIIKIIIIKSMHH